MSTGTYLSVNYETRRLEDKLDRILGFYYWRTYWATSMWSNLSTPLNLTITIFTALMASHSSSSTSFISDQLNTTINLVTFLLSIINSYFSPQKELNETNEYLGKWMDCGNDFESTVYSEIKNEEKIKIYQTILKNANELRKNQYITKRNFVTDLLHVIIRNLFMGGNDRWMKGSNHEFYEAILEELELDFDFNTLKYETKHSTLFSRLCSCFTCCFSNKNKEEDNKLDSNINHSTIDTKNNVFKIDINPIELPSLKKDEIELENLNIKK